MAYVTLQPTKKKCPHHTCKQNGSPNPSAKLLYQPMEDVFCPASTALLLSTHYNPSSVSSAHDSLSTKNPCYTVLRFTATLDISPGIAASKQWR
jgi:hypothetical protein